MQRTIDGTITKEKYVQFERFDSVTYAICEYGRERPKNTHTHTEHSQRIKSASELN